MFRRPIVLLIALYLLLGLIYAASTPIFEASDEIWHYAVVRELVTHHKLPVQTPGQKTTWVQEGSQPPLYYLTGALLTAGMTPGQVVIATKWWPTPRFAGSIGRTIDKRIKNLSPYPIDLHQVHFPRALSSIESVMDAMADLVEAGKIRAVGVSNYNAEQMRRAHARLAKRGIPLASNQVKYNLLDRTIEQNGVLAAAEALGITIIAYSPLEMGLLTGKFHADPGLLDSRPWRRRKKLRERLAITQSLIDRMATLAENYDATITQIGLNWLIHAHGPRVVAIPGATKPHHAADAAGTMRFILSADELAELDRLARSLTAYQPIGN
jgi:aryl-alcohol dehydrogenase-like predicted oxidoreductase